MALFNFKLDKETRKHLDFAAEKHRRSRGDMIRVLIAMEAEKLEKERTEPDNTKDA